VRGWRLLLLGLGALLCMGITLSAPAQGDPRARADQLIADAELALGRGEWDTAMAALEEASWYVVQGDSRYAEVVQARNLASFGKEKQDGDAAMERGDPTAAIRSYEAALNYCEHGPTRSLLAEARAALARGNTAVPATPSEPQVEPTTSEPIVPPEPEQPTEAATEASHLEADVPADPPDDRQVPVDSQVNRPALPVGTAGEAAAVTSRHGGFPWAWSFAWFVLVVLAITMTRTSVLSALATGFGNAGLNRASLVFYKLLAGRGTTHPAVRRARIECQVAQGWIDDEGRWACRKIHEDDIPGELVVRLAILYWEQGLVDGEAAMVYEAALEHAPHDPNLAMALDACDIDDEEAHAAIEALKRDNARISILEEELRAAKNTIASMERNVGELADIESRWSEARAAATTLKTRCGELESKLHRYQQKCDAYDVLWKRMLGSRGTLTARSAQADLELRLRALRDINPDEEMTDGEAETISFVLSRR